VTERTQFGFASVSGMAAAACSRLHLHATAEGVLDVVKTVTNRDLVN